MKRKVALTFCLAAILALFLMTTGEAATHRFKPTPAQYYYLFGGGKAALKVAPGDRVILWCEDALNGKIRSTDDLASKSGQRPNPQTGPIYVEGAEPGDTLAIKIVDIQFDRDYGWSPLPPYGGFLQSNQFTRMLQDPLPEVMYIYPINKERKTTTFVSHLGKEGYSVEIPWDPFMGTLGTAPAGGEHIDALTPYWHGGNMDCVETKPGTTVYLPVNVPGAMWSTGDIHVTQGDGEIIGGAIEITGWVTIDVLPLIKGKKVNTPRFENDEYLMSVGSIRPLDDCLRIAYGDMVDWLMEDYGLDRADAYQLLSQVGRVRVGNVVDTLYTVVAKFPKKYLPRK